jgi:predicted adenine nucleotide alpha hydrolase (AANH) superfamily ATPase
MYCTDRQTLTPPNGEKKVLLHSCCAPCSGEVIEAMHYSGLELEIFFYNPNIHPLKEYNIRKQENMRYADKLGISFVDADYDVQNWFSRAKGMENEPERGIRCTMCFDMRFQRTALHAYENDFKVFTSSLGISRWKNMQQINDCGTRAAEPYEGVDYWTYNWRQNGGGARMYEIAKAEEFYKQEYCGCIFSLRDTNKWRVSRGRDKIEIGTEFYGFDDNYCSGANNEDKQDG